MLIAQSKLGLAYRRARRVVIAVAGGTIVLAGVALLVLPGPAVIVIPIGLGILALEFAWARRWLRYVKQQSQALIDRAAGRGADRAAPPPPR